MQVTASIKSSNTSIRYNNIETITTSMVLDQHLCKIDLTVQKKTKHWDCSTICTIHIAILEQNYTSPN